MKKTTFLSVLAALCLFLSASGQDKTNIKPLRIGEPLPDLTFENTINFPAGQITTASRKGKLVILDFWATWCSPCVAAFPHMKNLQDKFGDKLIVLQVAYQPRKVVDDFYTSSAKAGQPRARLSGLVGDTILVKLFPHNQLPHFVWIDREGKYLASTEENEVTEANIEKAIAKGALHLQQKNDDPLQTYDNRRPMFLNSNGTVGSHLIYHSLLSGYVPGMKAGLTRYPPDSVLGLKITGRNIPLIWLFKAAYEEGKTMFMNNRTVIQLRDSSALINDANGQVYENWLKEGNGYCYELVVPPGMVNQAYKMMQRDLSLFFPQYAATVKKQTKECWILTRIAEQPPVKSRGEKPAQNFSVNGFTLTNGKLSNLLVQLNAIYMQQSPYPLIDESHIDYPVDLQVDANLTDMKSLNAGLAKYGLTFMKGQRNVDVLYITDSETDNKP